MKTTKSLVEMRQGEDGTIVSVESGRKLQARLSAMGIMPGVRLRKVSDSFLHGPVIVQVGNAHTALGFGMASKIIVEL